MEYNQTTLGDKTVFFNNQRKPVSKLDREPGSFPYYGAAGIQDYVSEYLFDGRYILIGEDGTVITTDGNPVVQIASGKFWVNNHAHVILPKDPNDFNFLYYAILASKIENLVTGAVQPKLSMTNLKTLQIPWPESASIRRAIAQTLRNIDELIEANQALANNLQALAQLVFKSWFINFDPVKARKNNKQPVGMDTTTASLFPDSLVESELGLIPEGWRICQIKDFGSVVTGKTPSTNKEEYWGDDVPFVTIPDMHGNLIIVSTRRSLTEVGAGSQRSQNIPTGSTIVSCIATPGLVSYAAVPCQTNQQINSVVPKSEYPAAWVFWQLKSLTQTLVQRSQIGTMFANLKKSDFSSIQSITPPEPLRMAFAVFADPILAQLENITRESLKLAKLRDLLLPRLTSGELQIPDDMLES